MIIKLTLEELKKIPIEKYNENNILISTVNFYAVPIAQNVYNSQDRIYTLTENRKNLFSELSETALIEFLELNLQYEEITDITKPYRQLLASKYKTFLSLEEIKKTYTRQKIEEDVGDDKDLIDDLSKRIALLERYVIFTLPFLIKGEAIPSFVNIEFTPMIETLQNKFLNKEIVDIIDIENSNDIMNNLMEKRTKITDIIKKNIK